MTTTGGPRPGTVTNHYAGSGDSPSWITEADGTWTRNVTALGGLAAIQKSDGTSTLQLANLHGDVVATCDNSTAATGIQAYFEQTEYGSPRPDNTTNPTRYAWLGTAQRSFDALAGLALMGVRLYNPTTGRFLQVDPVIGGNANAYDYCSADPINCRDLNGKRSCWLTCMAIAAAATVAAMAACSLTGLGFTGIICGAIGGGVGNVMVTWYKANWKWNGNDIFTSFMEGFGVALILGPMLKVLKAAARIIKNPKVQSVLNWLYKKLLTARSAGKHHSDGNLFWRY
jgi:RHS repeat-associated protein